MISNEGVDALTMRRLADELRVTPMTIYGHFENKSALLQAVGRRTLEEIDLPPASGVWEQQVVDLAHTLRRALVSGHTAALLSTLSEDLPLTVLHLADRGLSLMERVGLEGEEAVVAFRVLFWHTVGSALSDSAMRTLSPSSTASAVRQLDAVEIPAFHRLRGHFGPIDPEELFERTTRALALGLRAGTPRATD